MATAQAPLKKLLLNTTTVNILKTMLGGKFHEKLNAPSKSCNKNKKQLARRQCWRFEKIIYHCWKPNVIYYLLETVLRCCICLSIWSLCWIWHCRQVFEVNDCSFQMVIITWNGEWFVYRLCQKDYHDMKA